MTTLLGFALVLGPRYRRFGPAVFFAIYAIVLLLFTMPGMSRSWKKGWMRRYASKPFVTAQFCFGSPSMLPKYLSPEITFSLLPQYLPAATPVGWLVVG